MNFQIKILVNLQFSLKKFPILLKIPNLTKSGYMDEETANYMPITNKFKGKTILVLQEQL